MHKDEYAHALMLALKGVDEKEATKRAERFVALLRRAGHIRLLPKILATYERTTAERARKDGVVVSVAKEADAHTYANDIKKAAAELGASHEALTIRADETLVGGYSVKTRDKIIDRSFKRALLTIYHRAIAS